VIKRSIAFLLILFLLCLSLAAPGNAAPKAGSNCSKAGMERVISKKVYVCKKSRNKLTWKAKPTFPAKLESPTHSSNAPTSTQTQSSQSPSAPPADDVARQYTTLWLEYESLMGKAGATIGNLAASLNGPVTPEGKKLASSIKKELQYSRAWNPLESDLISVTTSIANLSAAISRGEAFLVEANR